MPTFRHGKTAVFKIDDSGGTLRDISDACNSISFPREAEVLETTSFGSSDRIVGFKNATISVEGSFDATYDGYLAGILGQDATVSFEYGPEGSTSTRVKYTGEAILTSYETSAGVGDVVNFSASLQISGAVTRGTY
jgi:predicted secreted protein